MSEEDTRCQEHAEKISVLSERMTTMGTCITEVKKIASRTETKVGTVVEALQGSIGSPGVLVQNELDKQKLGTSIARSNWLLGILYVALVTAFVMKLL